MTRVVKDRVGKQFELNLYGIEINIGDGRTTTFRGFELNLYGIEILGFDTKPMAHD